VSGNFTHSRETVMNKDETRKELNERLIKRATLGLIGDGVRKIELAELDIRVHDEAERLGEFAPSYPALVEALRGLDGYDVKVTHDVSFAMLPVIPDRELEKLNTFSEQLANIEGTSHDPTDEKILFPVKEQVEDKSRSICSISDDEALAFRVRASEAGKPFDVTVGSDFHPERPNKLAFFSEALRGKFCAQAIFHFTNDQFADLALAIVEKLDETGLGDVSEALDRVKVLEKIESEISRQICDILSHYEPDERAAARLDSRFDK